MNFRILIPYWGNKPQYRELLDKWLAAYKLLRLPYQVTIISDHHTVPIPHLEWTACPTAEFDAAYHFDHKGDIVCAAIKCILDPILVLDTDAVIAADPGPLLAPFYEHRIALPLDEGALNRCIRNRHGQETGIVKRCAGVMWFGQAYRRGDLVADYHWCVDELKSGRYYEERRLFEQHAWSMVAHRRAGGILPRELNWLDNNTRNGYNPKAVINHRIGQRKFSKLPHG